MEPLRVVLDANIVVSALIRLSHARNLPGPRYLQTAMAGRADYIVSGDGDLLALRQIEHIRIVTPAGFERILDETKGPG
jgi:predicted nucleic acid-binding protein